MYEHEQTGNNLIKYVQKKLYALYVQYTPFFVKFHLYPVLYWGMVASYNKIDIMKDEV